MDGKKKNNTYFLCVSSLWKEIEQSINGQSNWLVIIIDRRNKRKLCMRMKLLAIKMRVTYCFVIKGIEWTKWMVDKWSSEWICKCAHFYNGLPIKIQIEFEWWTSSCVEAPKVPHSRNKPVHSTFKCIVPSKRWMKRNSYNLFFFSHSKLTLMRLHLFPFSASNEKTPFNLSCFWFVCAILMFANA